MKIDTAIRAVFETEKRKPVRSSIATFLKQHCNRTPASWRCSKMDADAFLAFVSKLGLQEGKDYTVVRSSLDPHAIQLKWSANTAGRLSQALSEQPSGWLDAVYACAYSLETLPEGALADTANEEEPEEPAPVEAATGPFLADLVADKTLHIAQSIVRAEFPAGDVWTSDFPGTDRCDDAQRLRDWGDWYAAMAPDHPRHVPPFAPMPVVEAYVRVCLHTSRPEWPETPVFSCGDLRTGLLQEQHVRELYRQVRFDETVPQGNMFLMPLESQFYEGCDSAPLVKYFTRNLEDWRKQNPQDKVGAWVQFDTLVRPTVAAARFMLQPKNAARYVRDLYRIAYGQNVMMSGYTRIAVHNLFPEVPGSDEITCDPDDDDYNPSLAERIDNDSLKQYGLYYMGGLLVAAPDVYPTDVTVWRHRDELPTIDQNEPLDKFALRTDELGKEWFAIIHGAPSFEYRSGDTDIGNLGRLRHLFADLEMETPSRIDLLCSYAAGSSFFSSLGGLSSAHWTPHSTFANSICGILRRYGPQPRIEVADGYHTLVHRIWSGMTTSMSMSSEDPGAFPWVPSLPVVDQFLGDRASPPYAGYADKVTDALKRLNEHPDCQFRFTERESGSKERRNCVVMVETNVLASKFLDAVAGSGKVEELSRRLKLAFTAPYVFLACCPEVIATSPMSNILEAIDHYVNCNRIFNMTSALKAAGYQDMLKDHVTIADNGAVRFPRIDEFPVNVSVTWDKNDRLVILFSMDGEAAQFLRLLYRKEKQLPLATASYLKSRGRIPEGMFMMDGSLSQASNYVKYLKAQMKHNRFRSYASSPATFSGGEFSPVYDPDALRGFDWDEFPHRSWYDPGTAIRMSAVLNACG